MANVSLFLKVIAPIFLIVALMHLVLGPSAELMLGANIPPSVLVDPVLDSQNRFYGVVFALYGALFYVCATDLHKYRLVLHCVLIFFFAGGLARLVSIHQVGLPSTFVIALLITELILPVVIYFWLAKA